MNFEPHLRALDNETAGSVLRSSIAATATLARFHVHGRNAVRDDSSRTDLGALGYCL